MTDEPIPEPDRVAGAPHPRDAPRLFGQSAAEARFLDAYVSGRLHHAWLLAGPRGIGKATLAWRLARFLLSEPLDEGPDFFGTSEPPRCLDTNPEHPVARRVLAGSEPRLFLLRRGWDPKKERLRTEITVDETRALKSFFGLSAVDGGRRVVIVDAVDEMNKSAANALLKILEEPPPGAVLLLVSHRPAGLLPTIRSRCRTLACATLGADDMGAVLAQAGVDPGPAAGALAELSGGSAGAAIAMIADDGAAVYSQIVGLFDTAPRLDRQAAIKLANGAAGRGREARARLLVGLFETYLARLARTGAGHPPLSETAPGEARHLARLAPDAAAGRQWAALQQTLSDRARRGLAVNLDASGLILDMALKINETAAAILARS